MHESLSKVGLMRATDRFEVFIAIIDVQLGFVRTTAFKKNSFLLDARKDRHFDWIATASLVDIGSSKHYTGYYDY